MGRTSRAQLERQLRRIGARAEYLAWANSGADPERAWPPELTEFGATMSAESSLLYPLQVERVARLTLQFANEDRDILCLERCSGRADPVPRLLEIYQTGLDDGMIDSGDSFTRQAHHLMKTHFAENPKALIKLH